MSACYFDFDKLHTIGQTIKKYKQGRNTGRVLQKWVQKIVFKIEMTEETL